MNPTIVHYDNGGGEWEVIHLLEEAFDKIGEALGIK
jgi:hypothetical protein